MEGTFELNKLGWYTVQIVTPNDFLNDKLENDNYGIFYSVKFEGDADTHLWQAKTAPQSGERVYGHIEKTKSGKTTKFKRAKKEDIPTEASRGQSTSPAKKEWQPRDDDAIRAQFAIKTAVMLVSGKEVVTVPAIENWAKEIYAMVDRVKGSNSGSLGSREGAQSSPQTTQVMQNPVSTVGQTPHYQPDPVATYQRVAQEEYNPENYIPGDLPPEWP